MVYTKKLYNYIDIWLLDVKSSNLPIKLRRYTKYTIVNKHVCLYELLFLRKKLINMDVYVIITSSTFHNLYFRIMKSFLKFYIMRSFHSNTDKWNRLKKIFYRDLDGIVTLISSHYKIYNKYNLNSYTIHNSLSYKIQ